MQQGLTLKCYITSFEAIISDGNKNTLCDLLKE